MLGLHDLPLFLFSGLLLNMTPGPDSLLVLSQTATRGWRGGAVTALGIGTGTLVHVTAAALGLSALLSASATAFTVIKWAGALWLIWLGLSALLQRGTPAGTGRLSARPPVSASRGALFRRGLLTNALNPKVALFFLAFMPQFITPGTGLEPLAFLVLGLIFDVTGMLWSAVLIVTLTVTGQRLKPGATLKGLLARSVGALFVAMGIKLALTRAP
ncbi:threonine/homoserine/homoserine lactone efflux protein [Kushneria sinocarnis]|uniref:Threonine/homoserine/homoserine lactone efflux protein n=1 Tax=Kushneria sinocarnis TaxID=595502 RepID=A0A420WWC5_9GAMM|nr:LysE family translocator [Kushneria sinocarnis]RKR03402.1 threonine/homoserine/homoserine lactone efflux protein [Kushneria sinocarnis]